MKLRTIDTGAVELAVAEAGIGDDRLLLLHGFTGAKEDFADWIDNLADRGWDVVAPDHRGHGESAKPAQESEYSLEILAQDAVAVTETLGWDPFVLLGHSMGGMVAQRMAIEHSERIRGLVLLDTSHGPVSVEPHLVEAAIAMVRDAGMELFADFLDEIEGPLATPADQRVRDERPGYVEFGQRKLRASSGAMYAAMAGEMLGQADRLDALAKLDLPVLVVVGEQDDRFFPDAERMAEAIPGARLEVIPDAGHSPQFEAPERWGKIIAEFLEEVRSG